MFCHVLAASAAPPPQVHMRMLSEMCSARSAIGDRRSALQYMCDHSGVQQVEEMKQKLEQQLRVTEQLEKKQVKCIDMIRKLLLEKVCPSSSRSSTI